MLKIIAPFRFREDISRDDALRHWNDRHPDVVRRCIPGAVQYVQNVPLQMSRRTWPFDGVSELWFPDMDAVRNAYADEELQRELRADEAVFAQREQMEWLLTEERKVW